MVPTKPRWIDGAGNRTIAPWSFLAEAGAGRSADGWPQAQGLPGPVRFLRSGWRLRRARRPRCAPGVNQTLFASRDLKTTTDETATIAASAHPETPLRRAVGSSDPFALEPTASRCPGRTEEAGRESQALPSARPHGDRSKLDAAEKTLEAVAEEAMGFIEENGR